MGTVIDFDDNPVRRVLVVDDEPAVRSAIGRVLRREGFDVTMAANADDGMRALSSADPKPQVVLSDFRMPGMDGLTFLGEVRRNHPGVQRVLVSGYADVNALERAVNESEIFRFLSKPWDDVVLVSTVRSAYEEWRLRVDNERLYSLTQVQNSLLAEQSRTLEATVEERTQQLRLAKRDWEVTFDAIANPVLIVGPDLDVRRSNRAFAEHASLDVRDVVHRRCYSAFAGRDTPCTGCPVAAVRDTGRTAVSEVSVEHPTGERLFQVIAHPLWLGERGGASEPAHFVCHYRDVTDDKEMQQRLLQAEKLSGIGQLAGGVAHEINNPLAGILAFAQLMKRELDPANEHHQFVTEIEQNALRCKRIVESLLKFARRSPGTERSAVDVNEVLAGTLFLVEHQYRLHNVLIERDLARGLWPIRANANHVSQVMLNLLTNAYGAMREGGRIFVRTWNDEAGGLVRASVRDTGTGIAPKHLRKIFEPFFTTKTEGTGLGLTVSYDIVQSHGGTMDVRSEEGRGAEFIVSFPAIRERAQEEPRGLVA
jgi:two-component system NtrC family sensor kinase